MAVVLYFLSLLCLVGGLVVGGRYLRAPADQRQPDHVPFAVVLLAMCLTLLAIAIQMDVDSTGPVKDLLGAAIAVGGVVIAVFGMWLGHRRYRIEEAKQHIEIVRTELEQRKSDLESQKAAAEQDKRDREQAKSRIDSLLRVAEMLGATDAAVRAGALWTLPSLAAEWPDRVQDTVELACLCLRQAQDGQVCREAQQVIQRLASTHRGLHLDLTGARLTDFTLTDATIRTLVLSGAELSGTTALHRLSVPNEIIMSGAKFHGPLRIRSVRTGSIQAKATEFIGSILLESTTVTNSLHLSEGTAADEVALVQVTLGELDCGNRCFSSTARFDRVTVHGTATFIKTSFAHARFDGVTFRGKVVFDQSHFDMSLALRPKQPLTVVNMWKVTVGANAQFTLPPGWQVTVGEDRIRYLTAPSQ